MDLDETNKMCFNCRLSAFSIFQYLHPNQVNCVGITTVSICASQLYLIYKDQIKGQEFKCAICIWNLLLSTLNMRSKELSLSVKQAIIRLKNQNKPIREIAKTLGVAKSTVWNILKKKEHTGELSNTKKTQKITENNCGG